MTSKKLAKRGAALSMAAVMVIGSVTTAFAYNNAGEWKRDNVGWWWQNEDGSCLKSTGKWLDGNKDGVLELYYFDENGYLLTNTSIVDGIIEVNADGQWVKDGVVQTQGKKYEDVLAKISLSASNSNNNKKPVSIMSWGKGADGFWEYQNVTDQSKLFSYLKDVDKLENVSIAKPIGEGLVFPAIEVRISDDLCWENKSGGTDYQLYYWGNWGDYKAAGYKDEFYPNMQSYATFDTWTTPTGVTIDYLGRVLDENGKIKTATAEELGASYEGGKVRDVAYDSNYPLKRVVDLYALNIEKIDLTKWWDEEYCHHGLKNHISLITGTEQAYIISKLSGQKNPYEELSKSNGIVYYTEEEKTRYDAEVAVLKDWLNSFDFEHASEMERAEKMHDMLKKADYDQGFLEGSPERTDHVYYNMLIKKKGVCYDWAMTAQFLCALVGLKCDILGDAGHVMYVVQVDGVPHGGDNTGLKLEIDWREESKLGTRETYNYRFGEIIHY